MEDKCTNPVYQSVDEWLSSMGSTFNVYNASEEEVFYLAMQEQFPMISIETTNCFLKVARELLGKQKK